MLCFLMFGSSKKSTFCGHLFSQIKQKYLFLAQNKQKNPPVTHMISPKIEKICKTSRDFSNVERLPKVISTCLFSTTIFKKAFEIITNIISSCVAKQRLLALCLLALQIKVACLWNIRGKLPAKICHFHNYKNTRSKKLKYLRESENHQNDFFVSVNLNKTNQRMEVIGHCTDALCKLTQAKLWRSNEFFLSKGRTKNKCPQSQVKKLPYIRSKNFTNEILI